MATDMASNLTVFAAAMVTGATPNLTSYHGTRAPLNINGINQFNLSDAYDVLSLFAESQTVQSEPKYTRPSMDPFEMKLSGVVRWLKLYYTPSIIAVGLISGMVSALTLLRSLMKTLPSACYLGAASTVDFLYMLSLLVNWLVELGYPVYSVGAVCHATTFASKACSFLSTWYTVAYSVNALIAIKYPNAERQLCTVFRAKLVCLVLAIIAIVVFLNTSLLVTVIDLPTRQLCLPLESFGHIHRRLNQLDVFINFALPCLATVCICVACGVQCYKDGLCQRRGPHRPPQRSVHVECDIEAGVMTLYFAYIITNTLLLLPMNLRNAIFVISDMTSSPLQMTLKKIFIKEITVCLYHTKFACNLIVPLAAWKGFRATLAVLMGRTYKKLRILFRGLDGDDIEKAYVECGMDESGMALYTSESKSGNSV